MTPTLTGKAFRATQEALEYLKGETHVVATCCARTGHRPPSLAGDNVDLDALRSLAPAVARECGVPDTAAWHPVNGVQLFDYSSRSRCLEPCRKRLLCAGHSPPVVPATQEGRARAEGRDAVLVLPVGDALIEPFWTQGLGVNRGFHTAIVAAWAAHVRGRDGLAEAVRESRFGYQCLNYGQWSHLGKYVGDEWDSDPLSRYSTAVVKGVVGMVQGGKKGDPEEDLVKRVRA